MNKIKAFAEKHQVAITSIGLGLALAGCVAFSVAMYKQAVKNGIEYMEWFNTLTPEEQLIANKIFM